MTTGGSSRTLPVIVNRQLRRWDTEYGPVRPIAACITSCGGYFWDNIRNVYRGTLLLWNRGRTSCSPAVYVTISPVFPASLGALIRPTVGRPRQHAGSQGAFEENRPGGGPASLLRSQTVSPTRPAGLQSPPLGGRKGALYSLLEWMHLSPAWVGESACVCGNTRDVWSILRVHPCAVIPQKPVCK